MSKIQEPGELLTALDINSTAPSGADAKSIDLTALPGNMKPSSYLITAVVTGGASNLTMWGCSAQGVPNDETDDKWGHINDRYGNGPQIGTALAVGTHHFIREDLGVFQRLYFQKSANAIDIYVRPIYYGNRGN